MTAETPPSRQDAAAATERGRPIFALWARAGARLISERKLRDNEVALLVMSGLFGIAIGAGVVAIERLVQLLHQVNFAIAADQHLSAGGALDWWRVALVPIVGGLLAGSAQALVRRARAHEVVDAIEANALFGGKMSLTDSIALTLLTAISSGFGASVGMEAGFTQLGAGLASRIGQVLRLRRGDLRTVVGCGAAAAIAAAFNAPLAGAFYAFELVIGNYSPAVLAPISISALFATLVVRGINGSESIFALDTPVRIAGLDYGLFAVLGVVAAVIAIATMRGVTWIERLFRRLHVPAWVRPCIGGILIGLIATVYPEVLGSGHGAVQLALDHPFPIAILLGLIAAKGLASAISVGSGFRGGLFSSALLLGGVYGGAAVVVLHAALAALGLADGEFDRAAYMLVGMGSVAAGIVGAPVTMILLVLELTGSFPAAVGVMVGVIVATVVVRLTFGYSFATWRFHLRGVPIRSGYDIGWIQDLTVGRLMREDVHTAPLGTTIAEFRTRFPLGGHKRVFIVDDAGAYRGILVTADAYSPDLGEDAGQQPIDELRIARDQFLLPQHNVRIALHRFVAAETEALAVVSDAGRRQVVGFVTEGYVLRSYNQEFERVRADELGERTLFGPA
jgi:chloride channel protein, CIC family